MSNQFHDESKRKRQVKFRVSDDLLTYFDEWVEASAYDSRSAALRQYMTECASGKRTLPETDSREPPIEPDLRDAWYTLLDLRSEDGWVTEDQALSALAQQHSYNKRTVRRSLIKTLEDRGYLSRQVGHFGRSVSYEIYE